MLVEILIFILTSLVAYFVYVHKRIHYHFDKHGIKYLKGVPLFGNAFRSTCMKCHMVDDIDTVYRAFPNERYVGYIDGVDPVILIRDPETIKNITVKDFDHFMDHKEFFPEQIEPLFGGSLLMMKGEKWRDMRTTLSPAFTGSKMRLMMPFMTEISHNIVTYLKERQNENEPVDVRDLVQRYTNDVIASAGFGVVVNSLKDKDNEFYLNGLSFIQMNTLQRIQTFVVIQWPNLAKKLGCRVFLEKTNNFFRELVSTTINYREKNNVERPDMIQLLIEASKGELDNTNKHENDDVGFAAVNEALKSKKSTRKWTMEDLTAQVLIFFFAGFETSGSTLTMCIHELALNPDVQNKLYQEVKEFKEKNGNLTYEVIGQLKYLDCVLNEHTESHGLHDYSFSIVVETMRKWAAAIFLDRTCTKAYELPPPRDGGQPYTVKPGNIVVNVVNSLHMDEEHYPEPEKFNPDRFSADNKANIKPFTFLPFGIGPRNCIGSRFALLELKVLLYDLVSNFEIKKCEKTVEPIVLTPGDFTIRAKGGSFVQFVRRVK